MLLSIQNNIYNRMLLFLVCMGEREGEGMTPRSLMKLLNKKKTAIGGLFAYSIEMM